MFADLVPGIVAALGFGASNVFGKVALAAGADVLTLVVFRGFVGIAFVWAWLRYSPPAHPHSPRATKVGSRPSSSGDSASQEGLSNSVSANANVG